MLPIPFYTLRPASPCPDKADQVPTVTVRHGTVRYHTITVGLSSAAPQVSTNSSLGFQALGPSKFDSLSRPIPTYDLHSVSPRSSSLPNPQSCLRVSRVCSSGALARPRVSPLVLLLESQLPSRRAPAQYTIFDDIYEISIHFTRLWSEPLASSRYHGLSVRRHIGAPSSCLFEGTANNCHGEVLEPGHSRGT